MKPPLKVIIIIVIAVMLTQLKGISDFLGHIVGLIGGILGVVALIIAGVIPLYDRFKKWLYYKNPFKLLFTKYPYKGKQWVSDNLTIHNGQTVITMKVQPKKTTRFEKFHLLLVNREYDRGNESNDSCPDGEVILIKTLTIKNTDATPYRETKDNINGLWIHFYETPFKRLSDETIIFDVIIEAQKQWYGLIKFISECEGERSGNAYAKLSVYVGATK